MNGWERIWGREGLIDDEACPCEVGQRTASRHGLTDGNGFGRARG